jgi:hypothetical protein
MRFGVFDHLDDSGRPLARHFAERLELIEAYDRAGFYGYHLAEHHNTPLGYAPSPGIFLAAVAQRTKRLKFGPMVYLLPLYHPLRLIDEVCMLDQMSGGRFLYGVGRGISPVEVGFYGVDFATGAERFREAFEVIRLGLTEDVLTYHGKYYDFDRVPIAMKPLQKPYPELGTGRAGPTASPGRPSAAPISSPCATPRRRARSSTSPGRNGRSSGAANAICRCSASTATSSSPSATRKRATSRAAPTARGAGIWNICGRNTACRSR